MKILIVEDHEMVRKGMIALLQGEILGLEFHECSNVKEGFDAILSQDWDLVITDITMPGRSGLDLIRDIRAAKPRTQILVVSAHAERDYALRVLKLGAAGYLSKQCAAETLVAAVNRVLSGNRYITPAVAEMLAGAIGSQPAEVDHEALTNREMEVLRLIASGHSNKTAAAELDLSEKTIATYRARIAIKIGRSSTVDLTRYAIQHGLVG